MASTSTRRTMWAKPRWRLPAPTGMRPLCSCSYRLAQSSQPEAKDATAARFSVTRNGGVPLCSSLADKVKSLENPSAH